MGQSSRTRRRAAVAATMMLGMCGGCDLLTGTELRTILANSAASTLTGVVNTSFTTSFGAIASNVLGDIFKAIFGVT